MATLQMNILSMKLGMQSNFTVILPSFRPGVDAGKDLNELYPRDVRFRTLWLLPSEYGDDIEELHYTSIQRYADETGIAVVMPAPLNRMYSNDPTNQKFIDYITEELWSLGHGTFALSYRKEDNYIGGFSLGAYGALKAALRNTDKYSKVFMIGGVFEEGIKDGYFKDINARIAEQGLIPHLPLDDALPGDEELVVPEDVELPEVAVYFAAEDSLSDYARRAVTNLKAAGFEVTSKEYPGKDDWDFRDSALKAAVTEFIG
ncbi:MAG: hypothetical protein IKX27_06875 [Oscillospiraceae bacterium]|nr:hypothetical protein [Oscillospiraceae bacterium]